MSTPLPSRGQEPDDVLRRGLDGIGAQAGAPDVTNLRTAVVARAKRDRAVQRLATSAALVLPVGLAALTVSAMSQRDVSGNFAGSPDRIAATATVTATTTVRPPQPQPPHAPTRGPSAPGRSTVPVAPSVAAPAATIVPQPPSGVAPLVSLDIVGKEQTKSGYVLTYVISWSGADSPATRVDLRQDTNVLTSTPVTQPCASGKHAGSVKSTIAVIGNGPVGFQAVVHTQPCGGQERVGAASLTWRAQVSTEPTSTPIASPSATPEPSATVSPAPSGTPGAPGGASASPGATPSDAPSGAASAAPSTGGVISPPLPVQAVPTASPTAAAASLASPGSRSR